MKKQLALLLTGAALTFGGMQISDSLIASQEPEAEQFDMQEIMMKVMEAAKPGKEHEKLMSMAGEWDTKIKMKMDPSNLESDWEHYTGHSKLSKALGGRYLIEQFKGNLGMMGDFNGMLILGYNNVTEEFNSIWMDNFSTWPTTAAGGYDEEGNTAMHGTMKDVITPDGRPYRHVTHPIDADNYRTRMYDTIPGMGEVLVMEIHYTRVK